MKIFTPAFFLVALPLSLISSAQAIVILATDFTGASRNVTGNQLSGIDYTLLGVADPGALTAIEGTAEAPIQLAGLFDTVATSSHFAPNLNTDNEDDWSVTIPIIITGASLSINNVFLDGNMFDNNGNNQGANRNTDMFVSIIGSISGVETETLSTGGVTGSWDLTFFDTQAPIILSNIETWNLVIGTTNMPNNNGNNTGLDGFTVNGTIIAVPEPTSLALFSTGILMMLGRRSRRFSNL